MKIYDNGKEIFNYDKEIWSLIDNFKLRMENLLLHDLIDKVVFNVSDWEEFKTIQVLISDDDNFIQLNLTDDLQVQLLDVYLNNADYEVLKHLVFEKGNVGFETENLWMVSGVSF